MCSRCSTSVVRPQWFSSASTTPWRSAVGQAGADALDAPPERVLERVAGQRRLLALDLHEVVERLDRLPAPGIEAHGRNAEPCRQLDAALGVIDRGLPLLCVGRDEVLVDRQHRHREPAAERRLFQPVDVFRRLARPSGGAGSRRRRSPRRAASSITRSTGILRILEVPVRVSRHGQPHARRRRIRLRLTSGCARALQQRGERREGGTGEARLVG